MGNLSSPATPGMKFDANHEIVEARAQIEQSFEEGEIDETQDALFALGELADTLGECMDSVARRRLVAASYARMGMLYNVVGHIAQELRTLDEDPE